MIFPEADILVVCYDVASELSFYHALNEWIAELLSAYGNPERIPPLVLVGNKVDTRQLMEGHGIDVVLQTEGSKTSPSFSYTFPEL